VQIPLLPSLSLLAPKIAANSTNSATAANSTNSGAGDNSAKEMGGMFMQLLTAQLKSQSPISPLDPNQFVGQLAQFNSLSELVQIRELLQSLFTTATSTSK
jgi:flagellar basal-body rod modification protein FlgD